MPDEEATRPERVPQGDDTPPPESFWAEIRPLLGGLGWGVRWLGLSLAWGLSLFAFIVLLSYVIFGGEVGNAISFYGLVVVSGLLAAILSLLRRHYK